MDYCRVIIKGYKELAYLGWVVEVTKDIALITDDEGLNSIKSGVETNRTIGILLTEVFEFDASLCIAGGDKPNWSKLSNWNPDKNLIVN